MSLDNCFQNAPICHDPGTKPFLMHALSMLYLVAPMQDYHFICCHLDNKWQGLYNWSLVLECQWRITNRIEIFNKVKSSQIHVKQARANGAITSNFQKWLYILKTQNTWLHVLNSSNMMLDGLYILEFLMGAMTLKIIILTCNPGILACLWLQLWFPFLNCIICWD